MEPTKDPRPDQKLNDDPRTPPYPSPGESNPHPAPGSTQTPKK